MDKKEISEKSAFYEELIEHVFIAEIMQDALFRLSKYMEVLRSEIDSSGFDVVLECCNVIRHIQLKASFAGAKKTTVDVNIGLLEKPSGCLFPSCICTS